MTRVELLEALLYLWTRDAGIEPLLVERYVLDRMPPALATGTGLTYSDEERVQAVRDALATSSAWMVERLLA